MHRILFLTLLTTTFATAGNAPEMTLAVQFGGPKHDKVRCVNVDTQGNILICGEFGAEAAYGTHKISSAGDLDFFVAKLDPQGHALWAHSGGGTKVDRGYGIAADRDGNVYVTGHSQGGDAKFGDQALPNAGDYDVFVAKYSASGDLLWIKSDGGPGYDYGHGIAVSPEGKVFVTGAIVADKIARLFCTCYDGSGQRLWNRTTEGMARGSGHGVAVDAKGNAYVGGFSSGTGKLGSVELNSPNGQDILVAKFSSTGEVGWVQQGHGSKTALIHEISVDEDGYVWACGMFKNAPLVLADRTVENRGDSDPLLTCIDPEGKRLWTITGGSPKVDYGLGITTDHHGAAVFVGEFSETFELLGQSMTSKGSTDIFIAGIDRSGALRWLTQAGGEKGDNSYTATADGDGNVLFSGSITGTANFGSHAVTSNGAQDVYVARISRAK